jgi:hypothetical protein
MTGVLLQEYVSLLIEKIRTQKGQKGPLGEKFDLKHFKSLDNINTMLEYAKAFLQPLGEGSSRKAFLLSSKYALKIAINKKGLAQNEQELDVFTNPKSKPVVAKIYDAGSEHQWVISDLVKPLAAENAGKREFEEHTGIQWADFEADLTDFVKKKNEITPEDIELMGGHKAVAFIQAVVATARASNLLVGDLKEPSHWGKTPDGRLVLLDYGFSEDVWSQHYSKSQNVVPKTGKSTDKTNPGGSRSTTGVDSDVARRNKTPSAPEEMRTAPVKKRTPPPEEDLQRTRR